MRSARVSTATVDGGTSKWSVLRRHAGALAGLVAALCAQAAALPASAATQRIPLARDWNLISFNVAPADPRPEAVRAALDENFRSIWAYDAATKTWATYPPIPGEVELMTLAPGVGYWLRVYSATSLQIEGADAIAAGSAVPDLHPGWNLIGFVTAEPKGYDRALQGVPFHQLWTFVSGGFKGIVLEASGGESREDTEALEVQPGRGYWIWVAGTTAVSIQPELGTTLPPDLDVEPFLCGVTPCEQRVAFSKQDPGDRDIGRDGFFDLSDTQRAVDFGDFTSSQTLGIFNRGVGVLSWRVAIDDPSAASWLRFRVAGETPGADRFLAELSGSVATDSAAIELFVERRGLGPGRRTATLTVESNGRAGAQPVRTIQVAMDVPPLDGDYRVEATIEKVNGQPAELHNPRLFLSVYRDTDGLKGILDGSRTLLIPERCVGAEVGKACSRDGDCGQGRCEHYVRLAGRVYQSDTNRFTLSGSFELPAGAEDNPYQTALRRDVTLIGDRPKAGDTSLGPQDLTGTYHETIRNVLGDPIRLSGTFRASRVDALPSSRDEGVLLDRAGASLPRQIPENGSCLTPIPAIIVRDNLLLSEVDVRVDITHTQPAHLDVELVAPSGKRRTLRRNSGAPAGSVTYDATQQPLDTLDALIGDLSAGTWQLCVKDTVSGTTGVLNGWDLELKGTRVNDVRGRVQGAGAGVRVALSGCGYSGVATTNDKGEYKFENLIDCPYRLTVHHPTLEQAVEDVVLQGENREVLLRPQPRATPITVPEQFEDWRIEGTKCRVIRGAEGCHEAPTREAPCRFTSLTTSGGAGVYYEGCDKRQQPSCNPLGLSQAGGLQYAIESANFDIDRPPYLSCRSSVGTEDSNCFLASLDQGSTTPPPPRIGTFSNAKNCLSKNNSLDGPVDLYDAQGHIRQCPPPPAAPVRPCAVRAQVALGMPVIGYAVAGNLTMRIGANP